MITPDAERPAAKVHQSSRTRSIVSVFLFIASTLLLGASFFANLWGIAEQVWFANHQREMEAHVIGRIVESRQAGLLEAGGLTGMGRPAEDLPTREAVWDYQYEAFSEGLEFAKYGVYSSHLGGQAMLFGVLDQVLPVANSSKLDLLHLLNSLFSAAILAAVVLWFYREAGTWAALFALLSALLSQWLVVFGRNLWWSIWAFYLPMVALAFYLRNRKLIARRQLWAFSGLVFLVVFLKCFFTGYEYITTALFMMAVPFVYYAVRNRVGLRQFLLDSTMMVTASVLAILASFAVLVTQLMAGHGATPVQGVNHIIDSFQRRTYADPNAFDPALSESLRADVFSVVHTYIDGVFFDLSKYVEASAWIEQVLPLRYSALLVIFLLATVYLLLYRRNGSADHLPLIAATWVALLGPLSWYTIFKSHSYIHTHMNFLVWQMPFTFFGFALVGVALQRMFSRTRRTERQADQTAATTSSGLPPS